MNVLRESLKVEIGRDSNEPLLLNNLLDLLTHTNKTLKTALMKIDNECACHTSLKTLSLGKKIKYELEFVVDEKDKKLGEPKKYNPLYDGLKAFVKSSNKKDTNINAFIEADENYKKSFKNLCRSFYWGLASNEDELVLSIRDCEPRVIGYYDAIKMMEMENTTETKEVTITRFEARWMLQSVSFHITSDRDSTKRKWGFTDEDKRSFSARITDRDFLEQIENGYQTFKKSDAIHFEGLKHLSEDKIEYEITKILEKVNANDSKTFKALL